MGSFVIYDKKIIKKDKDRWKMRENTKKNLKVKYFNTTIECIAAHGPQLCIEY